ncbi:MAG: glycerate kinase [Acidobacteriota bacterium]
MDTSSPEVTLKEHALQIFREALRAVEPREAVRRHLRLEGDRLVAGAQSVELPRTGRVIVVGAGKASAAMAEAVEEILGDRVAGGVVSVKTGHAVPLRRIQVREASHPVPDEAGRRAAEEILAAAAKADADDLVLVLLSGGGSALMPLPAPGVSLEEKQEATRILLGCGASIHEINTVRKHLSRIKGGRLAAAAAPARVIALILSDVIGDDLDVIASGPTVPDPTTFRDCLAIVRKYRLEAKLPPTVLRHLREGEAGAIPETPKQDHPAFRRVLNVIVGSNAAAVAAAEQSARRLGYRTLVLSTLVEGEAREVGRVYAAILKEIRKSGRPLDPPACLLAGGEPTVTLRGVGKGGRNQELALAAAVALDGWKAVGLLSAGTDGTDGPTDAAGAWADGTTAHRAAAAGLDPSRHLDNNDAYPFFQALGDLLITGPTLTNVMDLHVLLAADG